ncbi:MAG: gamma-glutamylcyclotransferase [Lautropia sp.]
MPAPAAAPVARAGEADADLVITRDALRDGSVFRTLRATAPPGYTWRSEEELVATLEATLAGHDPDEDLHLFGYGSLMWNPAIDYADAARADVRGWTRKFCLWLMNGRGSPEAPGLMLALDRSAGPDDGCTGLAFRIRAACVRDELQLVWRREMGTGAYEAQWIDATIDGRPGRVLTFVANRTHPRYAGDLPDVEIARAIARARGQLGSCIGYFRSMADTLERHRIEDLSMRRLAAALHDLGDANRLG